MLEVGPKDKESRREASFSLAEAHLRILEGGVANLDECMSNLKESLPSLSDSPGGLHDVREELSLATPIILSLRREFKTLEKVCATLTINSESEGVLVKEILDQALALNVRMSEALVIYTDALKAIQESTRGKLH